MTKISTSTSKSAFSELAKKATARYHAAAKVPPPNGKPIRMIDPTGLFMKGITHSRAHRHRLIQRGEFPTATKIGPARDAWVEHALDAYLLVLSGADQKAA